MSQACFQNKGAHGSAKLSSPSFIKPAKMAATTTYKVFTSSLFCGVVPGILYDFLYLLWPGSIHAEPILKCYVNRLTATD